MKAMLKKIMPLFLINIIKQIFSSVGKCRENIHKNTKFFLDENNQIFFGYYDVTPFSNDENFLLAGRAPKENISPHDKHPFLHLGYYDLHQEKPKFQEITQTDTWNWQQGCRLQWFSQNVDQNKNISYQVIYNTQKDGKYVSVVRDILSGEIVKTLPLPIYSLSLDSSFALSLDFERLHDCRPGYGYNNFSDNPRKDLIWHIDTTSMEVKEIMAMVDISSFKSLPSMKNADHYFNHLSINSSGKRFMVTHLWVSPSGKRYTRIIVANSDGSKNYICPNNSGHTSHYCWQGDDKILIFGRHNDDKPCYHLYNLLDGQSISIGEGILKEDGHPNFINNNEMITDTYPDYFRQQHLLHYKTGAEKNTIIGSFHVPQHFTGEVRCDLHPRLNHKKDKVCLDIVRDGRRAMCIMDVHKK